VTMKNKINEVRQRGHPKEEQWSPRARFFTRGELFLIQRSYRRNSHKLQDPKPSPQDTGFLSRSYQNWMLGICMYCIGRRFLPLISPLFWDTLWLKSFWEKMTSKLACQCFWSVWSKAAFKSCKWEQTKLCSF